MKAAIKEKGIASETISEPRTFLRKKRTVKTTNKNDQPRVWTNSSICRVIDSPSYLGWCPNT